MKKITDQLPKPFFALAPLDDVSDTVFRRIISGCAKPELLYTEFTNVDALQSAGRSATLRRLDFEESEQPLIAQIWGKTPHNFTKTAEECTQKGFAGVDLNMGCPIKHVVQNGCCSALINDRDKAKDIIDATKSGLKPNISFSVKTRIGFKEVDLSWLEFLLEQDLDMLTVHLRTVREMSKVPAHWELMADIKMMRDQISPRTKLVGNGDVMSRKQGLDLIERYGIDGIMVGRGVFQDPFVFAENSPWPDYPKQKKIELYKKHVELFQATYPRDTRPIVILNKFCKIYISGFDGAKDLREDLMHCKDADQLLSKLDSVK
ncbi:MAG TPA: tRNA-dihydrouridine synthase [Patescibacteria group bacterium]|nr:tRNA-dihydrouridine synthase [Patescibacteria group bacterium]